MKKILSICLMALLLCAGVLGCTHVHTEECGKDGINCTHQCNQIILYGNEHRPF